MLISIQRVVVVSIGKKESHTPTTTQSQTQNTIPFALSLSHSTSQHTKHMLNMASKHSGIAYMKRSLSQCHPMPSAGNNIK